MKRPVLNDDKIKNEIGQGVKLYVVAMTDQANSWLSGEISEKGSLLVCVVRVAHFQVKPDFHPVLVEKIIRFRPVFHRLQSWQPAAAEQSQLESTWDEALFA